MKAIEIPFDSATVTLPDYDSSKIVLGNNIVQTIGNTAQETFVGPPAPVVANLYDYGANYIVGDVRPVSSREDLFAFWYNPSNTAAQGYFFFYFYDKVKNSFQNGSSLTINLPVTGTGHVGGTTTYFTRGTCLQFYQHTTGTISTSGTTVTGSGTNWVSNRIASGCRIGFGSTNPENITEWYQVSTINNETSITLLNSPASNIAEGTPYVIEEIRLYFTIISTNLNAVMGLYVVKGLNVDFLRGTSSLSIPAATSIDNIRACYALTEPNAAMTNAYTLTPGLTYTNTNHLLYSPHTSTNTLRYYVFNVRAALTFPVSGRSPDAFLYRTGIATSPNSGNFYTPTSTNIITVQHGTARGIPSIYITCVGTLSTGNYGRICRIDPSRILDSATDFIVDSMFHALPRVSSGGYYIHPASNTEPISVDYLPDVDRLVLGGHIYQYVNNYKATFQCYTSKYIVTTNIPPLATEEYEVPFGQSDIEIQRNIAQKTMEIVPHLSFTYGSTRLMVSGGTLYAWHNFWQATYDGAMLIALPAANCHWKYAETTKQRVITPKITIPGNIAFRRVAVNTKRWLGGEKTGLRPEPYRVLVRTTGIDDNSGKWTLLDFDGNLSKINASEEVQFAIEFRTLGHHCVPARLHSLAVFYDIQEDETDHRFQLSVKHSNKNLNQFAWRFAKTVGSRFNLTVKLYDSETGNLIIQDSTDESEGLFQRTSNDGLAWAAWNDTDLENNNVTTYVRYIPPRMAQNKSVKALLQVIKNPTAEVLRSSSSSSST